VTGSDSLYLGRGNQDVRGSRINRRIQSILKGDVTVLGGSEEPSGQSVPSRPFRSSAGLSTSWFELYPVDPDVIRLENGDDSSGTNGIKSLGKLDEAMEQMD
jgi:hypothetical protein